MLNRTLSRQFEKWCKFLAHIKVKMHKKKYVKKETLPVQRGGGGIATTHLLLWRYKGVSGQHHAPATLSSGNTCYP